jgi:phosphoglycerol transferase MdoB-like AlkP superfamily enzyme
MPCLLDLCQAIEQSVVGARVRESTWLFPILESLHLLCMTAFLALIGAFDLRLLGVTFRRLPVAGLSRCVFPWAWAAFAIQVGTGLLLFASEATKMYRNPAFRFKLLLIALAGLNALFFQVIVSKRGAEWEASAAPPIFARLAGAVSLLAWAGVVVAGRFIGFL